MNIVLQIYLEHKNDVIRNIEIDSEKSLVLSTSKHI